jgi:hypothetical protein
VDDAMVERYVNAVDDYLGGMSELQWQRERRDKHASLRRTARVGLTAALAHPQPDGPRFPQFVQDECLAVLRNVDTELRATGRASARIERLINLIAGIKPDGPRAGGKP